MSASLVPLESFFDPVQTAEFWNESIVNSKAFRKQITRHEELNRRLHEVLNSLPRPDMSLEIAIDQGYVKEKQAAELYAALSDLLSDHDYRRLVLYLPFELMPRKTWRPSGKKLRQALELFEWAYMRAWESLLSVHDVRANFTDGDVLEVEQREHDLPRVVKAAHLIPVLIEKGWLSMEDAIELMERNEDQTLKTSMTDALSALADPEFSPRVETVTLSFVWSTLDKELLRINEEDFGPVTKSRETWLRRKKRQETIDALGENISRMIIQGKLAHELLPCQATLASQQVLVEGIRSVVESVASTDLGKAYALYARHRATLLALWENDSADLRETLAKTFRRLRHLGVVDDKQLSELNITIPNLEGPFSKNLKLITDLVDIPGIANSIESTPELSQLIYPVVLVYGSRLNGYGTQRSDIDVAIFVRPGTPLGNRPRLQELLAKTFRHNLIPTVVEFWLQERERMLWVHDFESSDITIGESYWTHILFGAAWIGAKPAIQELFANLLAPYMYDDVKILHEQNARSLYLESMESASLQYRLMHSGYARFFAHYGARYDDRIDGKSTFWDSGYRYLATKLFLSRVFLPKIPVPSA